MFAGLQAKLIGIGGAILAGLLIAWRLVAMFTQAGVNKQKAKEAEARAENLKRIREAINAGNAVDPAGMSSDPNNRDNR